MKALLERLPKAKGTIGLHGTLYLDVITPTQVDTSFPALHYELEPIGPLPDVDGDGLDSEPESESSWEFAGLPSSP